MIFSYVNVTLTHTRGPEIILLDDNLGRTFLLRLLLLFPLSLATLCLSLLCEQVR